MRNPRDFAKPLAIGAPDPILEVPVKRILLGEDPARAASRESLANPAALDWFVDFAARA